MGVIIPAGAGARAAVEGYDPRLHDPFFDGVSDALADKGFVTAGLGPRILRAETAALAAVSAVQVLWGDLG